MEANDIEMPGFDVDSVHIPTVRLRSLRIQNLKAFDDHHYHFDNDDGELKDFMCYHGPNGCGKTTTLEAIQLVFSHFEGKTREEIVTRLGRLVRHSKQGDSGIYQDDDFEITAEIESSIGNYEVVINKTGFIKDHPPEIRDYLWRICFYTRYDQELNLFQLSRDKWDSFKKLFESVTGFEIEEQVDVFSTSEDPVQNEMYEKYVLGFWVHKPDEIIGHGECSSGEKKIIKAFSTLLNKEYEPQIVIIDDITMHVELRRHIHMVNCIKGCFPSSQIFSTSHSYQLTKNFPQKNELYDLRMIKANDVIKSCPWRLYLSDELLDAKAKLEGISGSNNTVKTMIGKCCLLIEACFVESDNDDLLNEAKRFLSDVPAFYLDDLILNFPSQSCPYVKNENKKIKKGNTQTTQKYVKA